MLPTDKDNKGHKERVQAIIADAGAPQSQRFVSAAKENGCDLSDEEFKDRLKKISKAKPKE